MGRRYNAVELEEFTAWVQQAAAELGIEPLEAADVAMILASAAEVSGALVRSAGPVAMYLAGFLVATGQAADVAAACRMVNRFMTDPGVA